jgi:hypothetical protein
MCNWFLNAIQSYGNFKNLTEKSFANLNPRFFDDSNKILQLTRMGGGMSKILIPIGVSQLTPFEVDKKNGSFCNRI